MLAAVARLDALSKGIGRGSAWEGLMALALADKGWRQAEGISELYRAFRVTRILSSPYLRTVQTVRPTAEALGLAVETRWDLREWTSGIEPTPDYARHFAHSWEHPDSARPGGESLAAFSDRVRRALTAVAAEHPGGVVLIGTHGTFAGRTLSATGHSVGWGFLKTMPMPAVHRVQWGGDHPIEATGPGL